MSEPPQSTSPDQATEHRLDSWKEIATYLRRDVTTVQRWERREGMPVHRHVHDKVGSVYAFRAELDAWSKSRTVGVAGAGLQQPPRPDKNDDVEAETGPASVPSRRRPLLLWSLAAAGLVLTGTLTVWQLTRSESEDDTPLGARFQQLTDSGSAAALSRDGRLVAFLSDRDGQMDIWVGQIGGQFYNRTRGTAGELVNHSLRSLAFSPDGSLVTYWTPASGSRQASTWAVPVRGGPVEPYLEEMVEPDWSQGGTRLVYHTPGEGDPMFVRDAGQQPRQIFAAAKGVHAHFLVWSPDQSFIYFVLGAVPLPRAVPDRTDIWRIPSSGGAAERITSHNARVSHPVFLDARTLLYLASESDGTGPSLYSLDVLRRTPPKRESFGIRYTTLAASADGSRVVATRSTSRKATLWRITLGETPVDLSAAERIALTTGSGSAPRFGPGFLLYVSSKGDSDIIWKLEGTAARDLWSEAGARVTGAPSISAIGGRITFVAERNRQTSLYVMNADGTDARPLTSSLQLQGAPAWAPHGRSITVGAVVDGTSRLLSVPVDGSAPRTIAHEFALDPAWSTDGHLLAYSGIDIGTAFPLKMIAGGGTPYQLSGPPLRRGSRRLVFLPSKRMLVVMRGEIEHKDLSLIDLETGAERQLTRFPANFLVRDFDISPDGREIVVEQVQENSEIVLIERPRR